MSLDGSYRLEVLIRTACRQALLLVIAWEADCYLQGCALKPINSEFISFVRRCFDTHSPVLILFGSQRRFRHCLLHSRL